MGAPYLPQRQQFALKVEVTEGVDSTPVDADVIAPVFDIEYTPSFELSEREAMSSTFSRLARISGEISAAISFTTELKGGSAAGTKPANLSAPFQACWMSETIVASTSVTYSPASVSLPSFTAEIREGSVNTDFKSKKILGARGTFTIEHTKGQPIRVVFELNGKYVEPTDTTAFTDAAVTPNPVAWLGAAFSHQGTSLTISSLTVDIGNRVVPRNSVNDPTGNTSAVITGRTPVGSIDPEQELNSVVNFFNQLTTNAEGSLTYTIGSVAGNVLTFTALKAQNINISDGDRDDIRTNEIELALNKNAAAGDDEMSIAFT